MRAKTTVFEKNNLSKFAASGLDSSSPTIMTVLPLLATTQEASHAIDKKFYWPGSEITLPQNQLALPGFTNLIDHDNQSYAANEMSKLGHFGIPFHSVPEMHGQNIYISFNLELSNIVKN